jgi:hypothetical protein
MVMVASALKERGHQITSRWIEGRYDGASRDENATYNLTDILAADGLVLFNDRVTTQAPYRPESGCQVELGYALRAGLRIFVVGPRVSLYEHLPQVECFANIEELVDGLR